MNGKTATDPENDDEKRYLPTSSDVGVASKKAKVGTDTFYELVLRLGQRKPDKPDDLAQLVEGIGQLGENGDSTRQASSFADEPGTSQWTDTRRLQPIQVVVDESNPCDSQQPSTSSSILSAAPYDSQQDAKIIARVAELRSQGLWSETRLPICVVPPRPKTHWDYLLEEVQWMWKDFRQERYIKRHWRKKVNALVLRKHRLRSIKERPQQPENREKEAKRMCGMVAKMIKEFWTTVDRVVDMRAQEIIESQKRRALGQHLDFIVGEADKISAMVHESLVEASPRQSTRGTPSIGDRDFSDTDDEDDETTIARHERLEKPVDIQAEINELQTQADVELDDILSSLPPEYLAELRKKMGSDEPDASTSKGTESVISDDTTLPGTSSRQEETPTPAPETPDAAGIAMDTEEAPSEDSTVRRQKLDDIAQEALKLQPKGFTLDTALVKAKVPFLLKGMLREYQHVGLDWLITMNERNLNGILADEMGLGKTIQTISLLAYLACEHAIWGPHLIVVPTSVILNWEIEFKKWCPAFKILTYFGTAKERAEKRKGWSKPNAFHVCITSYKVFTQDVRSFKMRAWQYLILDEAQNIKNFKSQRWQALLNLRTRRRLLLTGTPLQNSLMELWSLLHFLMPAIFASHDDFKDWFSNPLTGMVEGSIDFNADVVQRLHKVLRPFILRRLKADVEKQLPKKTEEVIKCALSKRQRLLYDEFMRQRTTIDSLRAGNIMSVLNIVMQLRKCCNHPNLFEPRPVVSPCVSTGVSLLQPRTAELAMEQAPTSTVMSLMSMIGSRTNSASLVRLGDPAALLAEIKREAEAPLPKITGFKFTADQKFKNFSTYVAPAPEEVAEKMDVDDDTRRQFLLPPKLSSYECKKGTAEKTEWYASCRRLLELPSLAAEDLSIVRKIYQRGISYTGAADSREAFDVVREAIQDRLGKRVQKAIKSFVMYVPRVFTDHHTSGSRADANRQRILSELMEQCRDPQADYVRVGFHLQFPELRLIEYDCGKLQMLGELLRRLHAHQHRCLIFTQMSKMLDILQVFLAHHGYQYFRLDGSTPVEQRQAMMERFNADNKIFCFILSTRSGGVGVNLTGADTVIFYDSDWNPTMDAQAQDRCHRIGQTRDVTIYRLISEKTIEENILKKAAQKRRLGEMAIDEAGFTPEFFRQTDNVRDLFIDDEQVRDIVAPCVVPDNAKDLQEAMASVEDAQDAVAARHAAAEANADNAEFDENGQVADRQEGAGAEDRYMELLQQLKPVERYAINFLENEYRPDLEEGMKAAEAMIAAKKQKFLQLKEGPDDLRFDDSPDVTFAGDELEKVLGLDLQLDEIPLTGWTPPSPPLSDVENDFVFDDSSAFWYESEIIPEEKLPSIVYEHRRPTKRQRSTQRRGHSREAELAHLANLGNIQLYSGSSPVSTPSTPVKIEPMETQRMRRESAEEISRYLSPIEETIDSVRRATKRPSQNRNMLSAFFDQPLVLPDFRRATPPDGLREAYDYEGPPWTAEENYRLITCLIKEHKLTSNALAQNAGLVINWDFVASCVNQVSSFYRSPKQCYWRYRSNIVGDEDPTIWEYTRKHRKAPPSVLDAVQRRKVSGMAHLRATVDAEARCSQQKIAMMKRLRAAIAPRPVPRSVGERFIGDQKPSTLIGRLPEVHQARLEDFNFNYAEVKQPLELLKDPKDRGAEDKRFHFMSPAVSRKPRTFRIAILKQKASRTAKEQASPSPVIERRVHCVASETDKDQNVLSTERLRHLYVDVNSLRQRSVVTQSIVTVPASVAPYQPASVSNVTPQGSPQVLRQQPYATQQSPQYSGAYNQSPVVSGAPYGSPSAMQPSTGGSPYRAQHAGGAAPMLAPAAYNVPTTSVPSHAQYGASMNPDQYHHQVYTSVPQQQQQIVQQPMHSASRSPNVSQPGPHQSYYSRTMQYPDGQHGQR